MFYLTYDIIPNALESFGSELAAFWPIVILVALLISIGKWGINLLVKKVSAEIQPIKDQVSNNGGSSLKDAIDRSETMTKDMFERVDQIFGILTSHDARLVGLIESAGEAWFEADATGSIKWVNVSYLSLFDLTYPEALENALVKMILPEDLYDFNSSTAHAANNKLPWAAEFRVALKDGTIKRIVGRSQPVIRDGILMGFVGTLLEAPRKLDY